MKKRSKTPRRLARYTVKRNFTRTREPAAAPAARGGKKLTYVIQRHAARRLHYDFRLEWKGTLRSWAVPKGPSTNPGDKRLAVEVEDHPLEYARFVGEIPKGEYGAGKVERWDYGSWEPLKDVDRGLRTGRLEFVLHGKRLHGRWHLVRTRMDASKPQWLLIKGRDEAASPLAAKPTTRVHKKVASKGVPWTLKPELATLVAETPGDEGWLYELKYDGVRLLCRLDGANVKCLSRNGLDWTHRVAPIVKALAALKLKGTWLDGELIATDENGRSDFSLLQHVMEQGQLSRLALCLFDILYLEGEDLRERPLLERKQILERMVNDLPPDGLLRLADQVQASSSDLLKRVCQRQLEGLIAKRTDAPYRAGRSLDWLKIKCRREQEFVVGGASYKRERGADELSSLLAGVRTDKGLRYVGRVGGGFSNEERREWHQRVLKAEQDESPFYNLPVRKGGERWRWMKPRHVIQVAFASWTTDGHLRQPRYLGIRADREPKTVVREEPQPLPAQSARPSRSGLKLTHPQKILFPQDGLTKQKLAEYYAMVAPWMLPHVHDRPLSIMRFASNTHPFYQKHFLRKNTTGLRVVDIRKATSEKDADTAYVVVTKEEGLIELAQLDAVELHTWGARARQPAKADRLTLDIDPGPKLPWSRAREVAFMIRKLLEDLDLQSFVKTTGGKGLHVVAPLTPPLPTWELAKSFTREISLYLERLAPDAFTSKTGERNRQQKIFVDYLRNGFGATAVAAFSTRWRKGVPVSVPLQWDELDDEDRRDDHFTVHNVPERLRLLKQDPWKNYAHVKQRLTVSHLRKLSGRRSASILEK